MAECPCCAEKLLRHIRHGGVYWFCTRCWQEMPDLASQVLDREHQQLIKSRKPQALVGR